GLSGSEFGGLRGRMFGGLGGSEFVGLRGRMFGGRMGRMGRNLRRKRELGCVRQCRAEKERGRGADFRPTLRPRSSA
ncbi:MAG: hypothetical protein LBT40_17615, partial [Deltaproteobacteria bacterium]|nr:hypothetical protein [Deltaproteobacteria bacterium]